MKKLILLLVMTLPTAIAAQELHTFSNGEVADAEKINENFQYVLENATGSGGCSAEQDGSNVVITCADGTSGVLASEGTVAFVPEGYVGEAPIENVPTGEIVTVDGNGDIIADRAANIESDEAGVKKVQVYFFTSDGERFFETYLVNVRNPESSQAVPTYAYLDRPTYIRFTEENCQGSAGVSIYENIYFRYQGSFVAGGRGDECGSSSTLFRSYKLADSWSNGEWTEDSTCYADIHSVPFCPIIDMTPPKIWDDIVYPIDVKQLP